MTLTKEDMGVLKVLVQKELEQVKKEGKKMLTSNSPFLGKGALGKSTLPFLKSEVEAVAYLEDLLQKL
jgi:hypothetical protein